MERLTHQVDHTISDALMQSRSSAHAGRSFSRRAWRFFNRFKHLTRGTLIRIILSERSFIWMNVHSNKGESMTASPDPIQAQLIAARRKQILEAAVKVFAEKGFHQTTIKEIAIEAGIAQGRSEEHTSELQSR